MFKIQDLIPFIVVAILGGWVGTMSLSNRPDPADITRIHDGMEAQRDALIPQFVAMGFSGEVKTNEIKYRKYPLPDERYFSRLELQSFVPGDSMMTVPTKDIYYDFSNRTDALFIMGLNGRKVKEGYTIRKAAGDSIFTVFDGEEMIMEQGLDWRLFIPDSIYDE
ncbi:MAG: hypothetical protein AAFV78_01515 [Bacteroidota bacterium]